MPSFSSYVQMFGDYLQEIPEAEPIIPDVSGAFFLDGYTQAPNDWQIVMAGASTDYASAPMSNPTNLDIRVRVALDDWTPSVGQVLAAKAATSDIGFILQVNTSGFVELVITLNGTTTSTGTTTSKPASIVADGAAIWIRADRTDSTGSTDFYTAPDNLNEPTVWTSLTPNRSTSAGAQFASTAAFSVGKTITGATSLNGAIYRAILRSSGVIISDMDPRDYQGGASWVSSVTGETWTLQGSALLVPKPLPVPAFWG